MICVDFRYKYLSPNSTVNIDSMLFNPYMLLMSVQCMSQQAITNTNWLCLRELPTITTGGGGCKLNINNTFVVPPLHSSPVWIKTIVLLPNEFYVKNCCGPLA